MEKFNTKSISNINGGAVYNFSLGQMTKFIKRFLNNYTYLIRT